VDDQEAKITQAKLKVEAAVSGPMPRTKADAKPKPQLNQDQFATKMTGQLEGLFSGKFKEHIMAIVEVRHDIDKHNRSSLATAFRHVEAAARVRAELVEET
jgi:hypothetical protein